MVILSAQRAVFCLYNELKLENIHQMEIHKYVPFLQHINENGSSKIEGTRLNPKFLYTGHGERNDSVIFHTEEEGKQYQYHRNVVSKDDLQLTCMYRKNRRANCRAGMRLKPKKHDLTYKRKINGKLRYFLSDEVKLTDQTGEDWETVANSGFHEHSEYCKNQVPKSDQPKLDESLREP